MLCALEYSGSILTLFLIHEVWPRIRRKFRNFPFLLIPWGHLPLRLSSTEVVFHWGCLPLSCPPPWFLYWVCLEVVFHWWCLPLRFSSTEVVFHWGRLPLGLSSTDDIFHWGYLLLRSSSTEVYFHWGCLPLRLSSTEIVFHWGCLPLWLSSTEVLFHWGTLLLRSLLGWWGKLKLKLTQPQVELEA